MTFQFGQPSFTIGPVNGHIVYNYRTKHWSKETFAKLIKMKPGPYRHVSMRNAEYQRYVAYYAK